MTNISTRSMPKAVTPDPSSYRMVALDLDGTLLNSQHQLSEASKNYLRWLDQQGFLVTVATGRALCTVYETIRSLQLPRPLPVVCSNGAKGYLCDVAHDNNGEVTVRSTELFSTPVPENVTATTIRLSKALGCVSQYYVGEQVYADPDQPHHLELTEKYMELTGCQTIYVKDGFEQALRQGLPSKQLVLCRESEQDDVMKAFEEEFSNNSEKPTLIRGSLGWFLEILHPDVCKGNGLSKMCDHLQIPIADCVAFGDGDNDYEFMQMAGRGIVMKNGRDVVKQIADEVIDYTNNEDGVIKTLKRMQQDGLLVLPKLQEAC